MDGVLLHVGLGLLQVIHRIRVSSSLFQVGACRVLGLATTLTAVEVVPFLVIAIGLDNMNSITRSIVSTSPDMAVRFRVAEVRLCRYYFPQPDRTRASRWRLCRSSSRCSACRHCCCSACTPTSRPSTSSRSSRPSASFATLCCRSATPGSWMHPLLARAGHVLRRRA